MSVFECVLTTLLAAGVIGIAISLSTAFQLMHDAIDLCSRRPLALKLRVRPERRKRLLRRSSLVERRIRRMVLVQGTQKGPYTDQF